jgi:protein O-mannosyl-transferase
MGLREDDVLLFSDMSATTNQQLMEDAQDPAGRWTLMGFLALIVLAFAGYMGVLFNDYITIDDPQYVYANEMVKKGLTGETIAWAFTSVTASNWHPLTMLSHLLDVSLFGVGEPGGQHGTALVLHIANACLLFWLLVKATGMTGRAWVVAALFAVHPIHVESVAWISSRKDVLSLFFVLLTMLAYVRWVERGRQVRDYWPIAAAYALALMSKPTAVTLPAVLLLMDFWPLKRWVAWKDVKGLVVEKLPLAGLCLAASVCTFIVQRLGNAMANASDVPMAARVMNAPVSYVRYLKKLLWPDDLAVLYPHPVYWGSAVVAFCVAVLVAVTCVVVYLAAKRGKGYALVGWLWFLGVLVPMIGLVQVGSQSMADRYAYISFIGLYIALVWGVAEALDAKRVNLRVRALVCIGVLVGLTLSTREQVGYWASPRSLYAHGVSVTKDNFFLLNNLGEAYLTEGKPDEALPYLKEAVRIHPGLIQGHENLGLALVQTGDYPGAVGEYRKAIELGSTRPATRLNLGWALLEAGQGKEALEVFRTMLDAQGPSPDVLTGMGASLAKIGREKDAKAMFDSVLKQWPDYMAVRYHYAKLLLTWKQGGEWTHGPRAATDPMGAINMLMPALKSGPGNTPVVLLMAKALETAGNKQNARTLLEAAIKDSPNDKRLQDALKYGQGVVEEQVLPPAAAPITIPQYTQ